MSVGCLHSIAVRMGSKVKYTEAAMMRQVDRQSEHVVLPVAQMLEHQRELKRLRLCVAKEILLRVFQVLQNRS